MEQSNVDVMCVICKAQFRPDSMIGAKCKTCDGLYPDATCLEDVKVKDKDRPKLLNENVIKELIYTILEEAGLKRKRCETCKNLFFPKSPAAKFCPDCKARAVTEKESK